jgi:hypothetical protein
LHVEIGPKRIDVVDGEIGNLNITPVVSFATSGSSGGIDRARIHADSRAVAPLNK